MASIQRITHQPRVLLYGRVSKDHRKANQGRSVHQQLSIGRRRAQENHWAIVGEFSDNDSSASQYSDDERQDWERAKRRIEAGDVDILWVWELSRSTRDLVVWASLARTCQQKRMFIAVDDELWDTTNPDHMKYLNHQMVDAAHEAGRTQKRIQRDVQARAEEGQVHGQPGFGFRHRYDPKTGELLGRVVHEPEAQVVREIAQRVISGESMHTIIMDLNTRRVPTKTGVAGEVVLDRDGVPVVDPATGQPRTHRGWQHVIVKDLLLRPALIGRRVHHGQIMPEGGHPPIFDGRVVNGVCLDEAAWWALRTKLQSKKAARDGRARYLLSGLAVCELCGGRMYRATHPNGWIYKCQGLYPGAPAAHLSSKGARVDVAVEAFIAAEFSMPDVLERLSPQQEGVADASARLEQVQEELETLYADVRTGRVSRRMAEADEERLCQERDALREAARPRRLDPLAEELAAPSPEEVLAVWRGWSLEQRRDALRSLTQEVIVRRVGQRWRSATPSELVRITWVGEG